MKTAHNTLFAFLDFLDTRRLHYTLTRTRTDAVDMIVTQVGRRIEISVFSDGHLEYSIFEGNEDVLSDEQALKALLTDRA